MLMVTRPITGMTCHKELPPINSHNPSINSSCEGTKQNKYIISPPADGHQTRQSADLQWEASIFKAAWKFDHFTNVRSIWKIYISTFARFMVSKPGRVLTYGMRFSTQRPESSPTTCFFIFLLPNAVFWQTAKNFSVKIVPQDFIHYAFGT